MLGLELFEYRSYLTCRSTKVPHNEILTGREQVSLKIFDSHSTYGGF